MSGKVKNPTAVIYLIRQAIADAQNETGSNREIAIEQTQDYFGILDRHLSSGGDLPAPWKGAS